MLLLRDGNSAISPRRRVPVALLLLIAAHGVVGLTPNPAARPWWTVGWLAVALVAFGVSVSRLESKLTIGPLIAVAAVLRVLVLPLEPSLSDDLLRYVWDGRVISSGLNPYLLAPEDPALADLRDERWRIMPHKEVPTVYPPLALGLFAVGATVPDPILGIKILLAFIDLGTCAMLFALASRLGVPNGRAAWYAWNPLAVLEVAGQGHVDGLMVAAMVAGLLLVEKGRPLLGGLAAAASVAAKLVPVAAIPAWIWILVRRPQGSKVALPFAVGAVGGTMLAFLPVAITTGIPPGLVTYGVSWEFNGPLYEPLWRAVDAADPIDGIKAGIDRARALTAGWIDDGFWHRLYPFVYPQFLAKLLLLGLFVLLWGRALWKAEDAVDAARLIFGAVLLCAATVYPWYLLWVLPWAALKRRVDWLVTAGLSVSAYLPQHTDIELFPWVWACIWSPLLIGFVWRRRLGKRPFEDGR